MNWIRGKEALTMTMKPHYKFCINDIGGWVEKINEDTGLLFSVTEMPLEGLVPVLVASKAV